MTPCKLAVPLAVLQLITESDSFLLVGHHKPDGDAVGSVIAMACVLRRMGKKADIYLETPLEEKLCFFESGLLSESGFLPHYDVLFYLDCSTADYAGMPNELIHFGKTLVVDHHLSNKGFGDVNFVEPVSATGELVFLIMEAFDIVPDKMIADGIYTALSTDTGQFTFSNLSPETFRIIGELYKVQKSYTVLAKSLHSVKSYCQTKLYGAACQSLTLYADGAVAVVILTKEILDAYGGMINVTDDVANIGVNIRNVVFSITFKEEKEGIYRVSLRSREPWPVDVSIPALQYGGGGHYRAAGLTFEGDPEDFIAEMTDYYYRCIEGDVHV